MSATGRPRQDGTKTVRDKDDNYETPPWAVRTIWPHVRPITGDVLDPCAGRGAILETLVAHTLYQPAYLHARELDQARFLRIPTANKLRCDWLPFEEPLRPKLILTNPPYRLALDFAQKAVEHVRPYGGEVCMLLRLNFLGSMRRASWLCTHRPSVYVLSRRPSFTPDGKTDATEYAWFVWGGGRGRANIHFPEIVG